MAADNPSIESPYGQLEALKAERDQAHRDLETAKDEWCKADRERITENTKVSVAKIKKWQGLEAQFRQARKQVLEEVAGEFERRANYHRDFGQTGVERQWKEAADYCRQENDVA